MRSRRPEQSKFIVVDPAGEPTTTPETPTEAIKSAGDRRTPRTTAQAVAFRDGETWLEAFRRVQREYAGTGRVYIVQCDVR